MNNRVRDAPSNRNLLGHSGERRDHAKGTNDARADARSRGCSVTCNDISDKSAVTVREVCKPNRLTVAGHKVCLFGHVADGVNMRVTRALVFINPHRTRLTEAKSGTHRE